jgi:cysteine-rich repeat protein
MNRSLRVALTFLVLATALPIASALAQPDAANARAFRCSASQLGAAGRLAHDVITCAAKAVRRAGAVEAACFAASLAKHSARTAAAQAEGGCITNPGTRDLADTGPLVAEVSAALAVDAPEAARSCAARKLRAAASEARALLGCYARSTRAGETVDAGCVAKARADYARVFAKAEARSGCATDGDAAAVEASIVDYAGRAVAALAAICGDGFVGPGEQCDGAADENCPGECLPFCACPGDCGNGVVEEPGEECDDGNVTSGDGCSSACQLENAKAVCAGVASVSGTS